MPLDESAAATLPQTAQWAPVFSLALGVVGYVSSEMLPSSLLTPIAADLRVSEGLAGQAVTTTALVAMVTSLFVSVVAGRLDRRHVLLAFTALLTASNLLAAFAANYPMLLTARVLLGLGLGGFWSMSAAVTMRLVPTLLVPRALSIIYGGVSVASVLAGPAGSALGGLIGWRGVFLALAVLNLAALAWQFAVLPNMAAFGQARFGTLLQLLRSPPIRLGMLGCVLAFFGNFAFFTYLRPFLEDVTRVDVNGVSMVLLAFGLANVSGTFFSGALIARSHIATLALAPLTMACAAACMVAFGANFPVMAALVAVWGFCMGTVPVSWTTWFTHMATREAESMGGLRVAGIQLAITSGAGLGGLLFDWRGPLAPFVGAAIIMLLTSALVIFRLRPQAQKAA